MQSRLTSAKHPRYQSAKQPVEASTGKRLRKAKSKKYGLDNSVAFQPRLSEVNGSARQNNYMVTPSNAQSDQVPTGFVSNTQPYSTSTNLRYNIKKKGQTDGQTAGLSGSASYRQIQKLNRHDPRRPTSAKEFGLHSMANRANQSVP